MAEVLIIGAGASGMAAAIEAARAGADVTVLESNARAGEKLKITGNGRCNIGNTGPVEDMYFGLDQEYADDIFSQVPTQDVRNFLMSCGIVLKEKDGLIYPYNEEASYVVNALVRAMEKEKVKLKTNAKVISVSKNGSGFIAVTADREYHCDRLVIAAGSCASDVDGADGSGYELGRSLGHKVLEPYPALVPFILKGSYFSKWAGVRINADITLYVDGIRAARESGNLQFTNYGVSGIAIFNLSVRSAPFLIEHRKVTLSIDMAPGISEPDVKELIMRYGPECILPVKLARVIRSMASGADSMVSGTDDMASEAERMASLIKDFPAEVEKAAGFGHAQCAFGGINTTELNADTSSRLTDGLYFCGEITDITGYCGGYNLQYALAGGILAGRSAAHDQD